MNPDSLEYRRWKCEERVQRCIRMLAELWFPGAKLDMSVIRRFDEEVAPYVQDGKETLVAVKCEKLEAWASKELTKQQFGGAA